MRAFAQHPQKSNDAAARSSASGIRIAFLAATIVAGAGALLSSLMHVAREPPGAGWLALLAMTCVSGWALLRMPGFPVSVSPSDTLTITAALLFGPSAGTVCVACDTLASSMRLRRPHRTITTVMFNLTGPPLAMWLAASLFFRMTGGPPFEADTPTLGATVLPLSVFATTYFLLNSGLVAGAITIGREGSLPRVWRDHFAPLWLTVFGGTSVAGLLLLSMTAGLFNLETLIVALPLIIVVVTAFRARLERVRRRSAEYTELRSYAAALRSTSDAVLLADTTGQVTFMNAMAERLTGWTGAEARGRSADDVLQTQPGADGPDRSGNEWSGSVRESVLVRRDGTTCPIEETHAPIHEEDGTVGGSIRTFRDITVRKRLEAERQALLLREREARAAADAAGRAKDEFLATLSHELRTPVMAVAGWVRLLKDNRLGGEDAQNALVVLERTVRAQAAVLRDVLDMSAIVRGALTLSLRRTEVGEILTQTIETIEPAVRAKSLDLQVHLEPHLPAIEADPQRLRQVFWNLLSNAVKFTPPGGSIAVSATRRHADVRVEILDSGCGLPSHFLPFIFERFRQADSSDTRPYPGLGLGLAIVRYLVEAHGGHVMAASDGPGRGARFVITLPAPPQPDHGVDVTARATKTWIEGRVPPEM